jgi:cytochrome-b5 reductase
MSFGKQDVKTAKKDLKSPFDPSKFIDLKLKRVEPYNNNTSK